MAADRRDVRNRKPVGRRAGPGGKSDLLLRRPRARRDSRRRSRRSGLCPGV